MDVGDRSRRVQAGGLRLGAIAGLQILLRVDVGDGQPLACGECRIAREVLAQRLLQFVRARVLAPDGIRGSNW